MNSDVPSDCFSRFVPAGRGGGEGLGVSVAVGRGVTVGLGVGVSVFVGVSVAVANRFGISAAPEHDKIGSVRIRSKILIRWSTLLAFMFSPK